MEAVERELRVAEVRAVTRRPLTVVIENREIRALSDRYRAARP